MKLLKAPVLALAIAVLTAGIAKADIYSATFDYEWPTTETGDIIGGTSANPAGFALPDVLTINSITIEISHTWQGDIEFSIFDSTGAQHFLIDNTGGAADLGVVGDGTLGDVASYVFTPPGTGAGVWGPLGGGASVSDEFPIGPFAAGAWDLLVTDTAGGDGGAIGTITIDYTPSVIPEPASAALLLGLGGLVVLRRRRK